MEQRAASGPEEQGGGGARVDLWIQSPEQGNRPAGESAPCRTNIQGDEPASSCEVKAVFRGDVSAPKKKKMYLHDVWLQRTSQVKSLVKNDEGLDSKASDLLLSWPLVKMTNPENPRDVTK